MILIIDDDVAIQSALRVLLDIEGFKTKSLHHTDAGLAFLQESRPDLVILDLNYTDRTSGEEGLRFLRQLKEKYPDVPAILITGWGSIPLAVEGMKLGASDFINKPWDDDELVKAIRTALALSDQKVEANPQRLQLDKNYDFNNIIGESEDMTGILDTISRVCETDAPVLILGESGTGKEMIAEAVHKNSHRREKPFVKVNLGGISTSLFESEMFGHKKGAFTDAQSNRVGRFELAEGGTIFLDEIGDLDMASQVKLLRVLQDKTYQVLGDSNTKRANVRVVAATNKDLNQMIDQGLFREDLYYRINLVTLRLPTLTERAEDIPLLVHHFMESLRNDYNKNTTLSKEAMMWLMKQSFTGNIRELRNTLERTFLLSKSARLTVEDFETMGNAATQKKALIPGDMTLEEMEVLMIKNALKKHKNNISKVADTLGLSRGALYRRFEKYDIDVADNGES